MIGTIKKQSFGQEGVSDVLVLIPAGIGKQFHSEMDSNLFRLES